MGNGLIIHTTICRPDGIELTFMRLCGVDRMRVFNPRNSEFAWYNALDGASLQSVDNKTINDNHEKVYQNLLNN